MRAVPAPGGRLGIPAPPRTKEHHVRPPPARPPRHRRPPGAGRPPGTANALVALTGGGERRPHYLELIGPGPEREDEELPKTFSITRLKRPTLITYAVHPEGIDQVAERSRAAGVDPG